MIATVSAATDTLGPAFGLAGAGTGTAETAADAGPGLTGSLGAGCDASGSGIGCPVVCGADACSGAGAGDASEPTGAGVSVGWVGVCCGSISGIVADYKEYTPPASLTMPSATKSRNTSSNRSSEISSANWTLVRGPSPS